MVQGERRKRVLKCNLKKKNYFSGKIALSFMEKSNAI